MPISLEAAVRIMAHVRAIPPAQESQKGMIVMREIAYFFDKHVPEEAFVAVPNLEAMDRYGRQPGLEGYIAWAERLAEIFFEESEQCDSKSEMYILEHAAEIVERCVSHARLRSSH